MKKWGLIRISPAFFRSPTRENSYSVPLQITRRGSMFCDLCVRAYASTPAFKRSTPSLPRKLDSQPQAVAGSMDEVLAAAQVGLGGLDRFVAQRELNLLDRRAAFARELREGPAQIVGGDAGQGSLAGRQPVVDPVDLPIDQPADRLRRH